MLPRIALLGALIAHLGWTQLPDDRVEPGPGVFLVARPDVGGGPFWRSVVLLLAHGEEGTLGVIVNRPTEVVLGDILPELEAGADRPVQFGGPVALDGLLFLFRSEEPPEGARHVMEDVYHDGRVETLEELLAGESEPAWLKLLLGHAGWAPGQLDAEIRRGSWDVVEADAFTVFGKDPASMWRELSGRAGPTVARASACLTVGGFGVNPCTERFSYLGSLPTRRVF